MLEINNINIKTIYMLIKTYNSFIKYNKNDSICITITITITITTTISIKDMKTFLNNYSKRGLGIYFVAF